MHVVPQLSPFLGGHAGIPLDRLILHAGVARGNLLWRRRARRSRAPEASPALPLLLGRSRKRQRQQQRCTAENTQDFSHCLFRLARVPVNCLVRMGTA